MSDPTPPAPVSLNDPKAEDKSADEKNDEAADSPKLLADDAVAVVPGIRGKRSNQKSDNEPWGQAVVIKPFDESPLDEDGFVGVDPNFRRGTVVTED